MKASTDPKAENQVVDASEAYSVEDINDSSNMRTSQADQTGTPSSGTETTSEDSPLALIRKDNRAVSRARTLVVLLLLLAALGTSYFVYYFARESEKEAFKIEFAAIADRMKESFLADTGLRMNQISTVAAGLTMVLRAYGTTLSNLDIEDGEWARLTLGLIKIGKSPLFAYSPYLRTDEERISFEERVAELSGNFAGPIPPCYLCGKGVELLNPDDYFEISGSGSYRCQDGLIAGLVGTFNGDFCEAMKIVFSQSCFCDPSMTPQDEDEPDTEGEKDQGWPVENGIFRMQGLNATTQAYNSAPYAPLFQVVASVAPAPPNMYDQLSEPYRREAIQHAVDHSMAIFSKMIKREEYSFYSQFAGWEDKTSISVHYPIFNADDPVPAGVATVDFAVEDYFTTLFPSNSHMVLAVLQNSCGQVVTAKPDIAGRSMVVIGHEDLHDVEYDYLWQGTSFEDYDEYVDSNSPDLNETIAEHGDDDYCRYRLHVYATQELEEFHQTNKPFVYAAITAIVFLFTTIVFAFYDVRVRKRQEKVMEAAIRTNNIVASLFPQNVRDRLYEQVDGRAAADNAKTNRFQNFLNDGDAEKTDNAIADLFPHCTIAFIDIAGFTAWSSEREPQQVFRLLEALYGSFDDVAHSLNVFKVETIGDSYVAACGLPSAKKDHAVVMVRFANQCLRRMNRITHDLERYLGPSTGDLEARCGLHSGPVTAGVLRGEKARFQLFGDTMNTAARMESSGISGRIHVSPATAFELRLQGKGHWLTERADVVHLKGKGPLTTFWAIPRPKSGSSPSVRSATNSTEYSTNQSSQGEKDRQEAERIERLVDWNVEVLLQHLQPVMNSRASKPRRTASSVDKIRSAEQDILCDRTGIVVDEMTNILDMPDFDPNMVLVTSQEVVIPPRAKQQLREFVLMIANMYRNTPFHNFDHASHVVMSAGKLMKRIVSPDHVDYSQQDVVSIAREIHESTYGISSDPLLLFATVFSALIHDVDHTGMTNHELIQLRAPISLSYRERSVAEQNSVDLAWGLLMSEQFTDLRDCIYGSEKELHRFRQLLVNATMATDIADKEFQQLRKNRWKDAFMDDKSSIAPSIVDDNMNESEEDPKIEVHRKATIVLEHIIQASDVAHTMQHWHVYLKYNKRLFEERYLAWLEGVAGEDDPSVGWYKGEIGFFDFYIIPLARKLDRCGVFGVSYHEYLQYAISNKAEWQDKGESVVKEMLAECRAKYGDTPKSSF